MIRNRIYRLEKVNKLKLQDKIVTILTAIIIILILGISGGTQFYDLLSRNQTDIPNDSPVPITTPVATAAPTPTPFCQTPSPSPSLTPQTTTNSIPTPEITTNPSSTSITTQTSVPLDLWWQTNWASNGAAFNVTYNKVPNPQPLVESLSSKSIRNDYGGLINNTEDQRATIWRHLWKTIRHYNNIKQLFFWITSVSNPKSTCSLGKPRLPCVIIL